VAVSAATLFIDRDGTLIEEPADGQGDSLAKVRFMPGVFAALAEAARRGYRLVMVTNPHAAFAEAQQFILDTFSSQGITFEAVLVRGLVQQYLREHEVDSQASAVIGDRDTDPEFAANLKVRGIGVRRHGAPHETWAAALQELSARRAQLVRETNETRI
jgi:imidazoleglycerol-phosphate dehydratase/histidinol-phosphatase